MYRPVNYIKQVSKQDCYTRALSHWRWLDMTCTVFDFLDIQWTNKWTLKIWWLRRKTGHKIRRQRRGKKFYCCSTGQSTTSTPWKFDSVRLRNSTAPRSNVYDRLCYSWLWLCFLVSFSPVIGWQVSVFCTSQVIGREDCLWNHY